MINCNKIFNFALKDLNEESFHNFLCYAYGYLSSQLEVKKEINMTQTYRTLSAEISFLKMMEKEEDNGKD